MVAFHSAVGGRVSYRDEPAVAFWDDGGGGADILRKGRRSEGATGIMHERAALLERGRDLPGVFDLRREQRSWRSNHRSAPTCLHRRISGFTKI